MFLRGLLSRLLSFLAGLFTEKEQKSPITFNEWLELLRRVSREGFESEAYERLKEGFPEYAQSYSETDGNFLIAREMSAFANERIALSVKAFQDDISQALMENDEGFMERAFRTLRRELGEVLFYEELKGFPKDLARQLTEKIVETVVKWQTEYGKALRDNFELFPAGSLEEELLWLFTINPPAGMLRNTGEGTEDHA